MLMVSKRRNVAKIQIVNHSGYYYLAKELLQLIHDMLAALLVPSRELCRLDVLASCMRL
jgi:hypothetical protein